MGAGASREEHHSVVSNTDSARRGETIVRETGLLLMRDDAFVISVTTHPSTPPPFLGPRSSFSHLLSE